MGYTYCNWGDCKTCISRAHRRCPAHRGLSWYDEFILLIKKQYVSGDINTESELESAIEIVYEHRLAGGPTEARNRLEAVHGLDPKIFQQND